MRELLAEFINLGGQGIEVVCGSHTPEQYVGCPLCQGI